MAPTELLGRWSLRRRVADRRSGRHGTVTGTLDLAAVADGVRWFEQGTFGWAGSRFEVSRELLVVPDGDGWTVCFADGRRFHPWRPGEPVTHPCRADVYHGLVDATVDRLRVLWDVTGPAKQQRIVTRCRPL